MDELEYEKCEAEYDSFWIYDLHISHACLQCRTSKLADRCDEGKRLNAEYYRCLVDYTDYMTEKGGRPWSLFGGYGDEE